MPAKIELTWPNDAENAEGFGIERKEGTEGTYVEIARVAANVVTYLDSDLKYSTLYTYRVYAYNSSPEDSGNGPGRSPYTPEASATTAAMPLPKAPTGLTVRPI